MAERILPHVSIVVPTHNRQALLADLLSSLEAQTYPKTLFDVHIVHNFTDDKTEEFVIQKMTESSLSITYSKRFNQTPTPSRHLGGQQAKGEIIAFIDDDCVAVPTWLREGVDAFFDKDTDATIDPQIGIVQGQTIPNPDHERKFLEKTVNISEQTLFYETCNIFYSKKAFDEVGGFSEEFMDRFYGEDTDLGWKVIGAGYRKKFNSSALVKHHVFHVNIWRWLKEPLFFNHLPYLVKKYPEFRSHFYANYFLSQETAFFQLFLIGCLISVVASPWALLLCLPYFVLRYSNGSAMPNPILRLIRIGAGLPRSCFTWYALVKGSLKYRSILL